MKKQVPFSLFLQGGMKKAIVNGVSWRRLYRVVGRSTSVLFIQRLPNFSFFHLIHEHFHLDPPGIISCLRTSLTMQVQCMRNTCAPTEISKWVCSWNTRSLTWWGGCMMCESGNKPESSMNMLSLTCKYMWEDTSTLSLRVWFMH